MLIGRFEMPGVVTGGNEDREKRERIRTEAAKVFTCVPRNVKQWAFRTHVRKAGYRRFDIENVPKLIVDAFYKWQIDSDGSAYKQLSFYELFLAEDPPRS